jgi:uncharacterized protein
MDNEKENSFQIITEAIETTNPVLINGFPGIGLVGNIACQHIIDELKMTQKGTIDSKYFPPIAVLFNGIVSMPVRIYESTQHNLLVIISDIPVHPTISHDLSKEIINWAQQINVKEIIPIAGIATMSGEHRVFGSATTSELLERIKDKVEIFQVGTISGIAGSIMTTCYLQKIPAISLLGETHSQNPEPRAAIAVIQALNSIYNLQIDTQNLLEQAKQIEIELQKLADQVRSTETAPPPRKEFPMYG